MRTDGGRSRRLLAFKLGAAQGPGCKGPGRCQLACCLTFDCENNVSFIPVTAGVVKMDVEGKVNYYDKKKQRKRPVTSEEAQYHSDPEVVSPTCKGMFDKFDFDKPNPEGDASAA